MSEHTLVGEAGRSRLQLDERREQLLELGLQLFSERSYDEVAIDDIAKAAGISKGLLYHYFGSKRAFYVQVIRVAAARLLEATQPDSDLPDVERARAGIDAYLVYVSERAGAYRALMRGGIGVDPEVLGVIEDVRAEIIQRMMAGVGLEQPRPIFRNTARAWIGAVEAASLDWLEHQDIERETLVEMLLSSLGASLMIASQKDPEAGVEIRPPE